MTYDVIIIGSGLGGLFAGAKLAKEGKKVIVIEQHSKTGGYASCFTRKDYTIDFGLHAMDGLYERDPKLKVFKDLDVYFNVEFEKNLTGFYRYTNGKIDFKIPDDVEDAIEILSEKFPEERNGIVKFFKTIDTLTKHTHKIPRSLFVQALIGPFVPILFSSIPRWGGKTAGDLLDSHFKNEDLKLALAGTILYYGDDPYNLSAIIFALALSSRFKGGTHYIKGGSVKLTSHLTNYIQEKGGSVLLDRKVTKIIVKGGKARGVEYVSTSSPNRKPIRIDGKFVVANAAIPHVVNDLLGEKVNKKFRAAVNKMEVGHSSIDIYLGFKKPLKELGYSDYTTVVNNPELTNLHDVISNHKGDYSKRNYIFIDHSQIDSWTAPLGKSTGVISAVDYLENWEDLSQEDYENKKRDTITLFLQRLNELIPDVLQYVDYANIATPRTKVEYTLNPKGSLLGFAYSVKQSGMNRLKTKSPIKNLYFASAWTFPGGGFSSTIQSGWQCARELLKNL